MSKLIAFFWDRCAPIYYSMKSKGMQQAKGYSDCARFDAKYVFSTNGHLYAKYSKFTGEQTGPFPFGDFPDHAKLTECFAKNTGIKVTKTEASMLFMADSPAFPEFRYYQDAAIRAAFEKIIQCEQDGDPARVLLSLATGAGKTIIAANLLWRLHEAERLPKPALFLCDRDELREQPFNVPKGQAARNFKQAVTPASETKRHVFMGFSKCCYPLQRFDSDPERRFAVLADGDKTVEKWMKPGKGQFQINYRSGEDYEPDFVVETKGRVLICEVKARSELLNDPIVLAKAQAAIKWCEAATRHAAEVKAKPWSYLLIPDDAVMGAATLDGIAAAHMR